MSDVSTSTNCRICNVTLTKRCILVFDCSHQLCPTCVRLAEGRSVCPTCSPIKSPLCADGDSPIYARMYSKYTEQVPPKDSPPTKTIENLLNHLSVQSSRSSVPSSFLLPPSASCPSSPSVSPRRLSPNGRASPDTCITARMDYAEGADPSALSLLNQRQSWDRQSVERETRRHLESAFDDGGARGFGSVRGDLADYVRTLREHSVAFRERLDQTGINEAVFVEKVAAVEAEVRRQARERRRAIDRAERELLLKLESRKKEQVEESKAVRQDTELCIGQLDSLTKAIEEALEMREEASLDQVLFEVQGEVRRVLERRVATVQFGSVSLIYSPENFLREETINILGEIEFPPNKDKADDHLMFLSSPPPLIHSLDDPSCSGQAVIGLTVLAGRIYAIRPNSHNIEVYHGQYFSRLRSLSLLRLLTPMLVPSATDLASCPKTQTLYVSDTANGYIYRIDQEGKLITHWKLPQSFAGLSVTDTGTILAGSGSRIVEYDEKGKTLRTIGRPTLCSKVIAKRRSAFAADSPRHFVRRRTVGGTVVCDWKVQGPNHVVYEIDDHGLMLNCFGGQPGSGDAQLNEPCCLATAPLDHVVVADRVNRRVKLLDSGLNFVRNLVDEGQLGEGEVRPNRIHLEDDSGRLYIGMTDGRILILRTIF